MMGTLLASSDGSHWYEAILNLKAPVRPEKVTGSRWLRYASFSEELQEVAIKIAENCRP